MAQAGAYNPLAATCEDYHEDDEAPLRQQSPVANVTAKRSSKPARDPLRPEVAHRYGSDSGYSSKTGTADSEASLERANMKNLKINTLVGERERQPYHMAATQQDHTRSGSTRPKDNAARPAPAQSPTYYKHEAGICRICDHYGRHIDITKERRRSTSVAPAPVPAPLLPKVSRQSTKTARDDAAIPRSARRESTTKGARPLSIHTSTPVQFPYPAAHAVYTAPLITPPMWQNPLTPMTPTVPYSPITYTYTPISSQATPYAHVTHGSYFDGVAIKQTRRASVHEDSLTQDRPSHPSRSRGSSQHEDRSDRAVQQSARSSDRDRQAMPPPARPPLAEIASRRPSIKKSATYNVVVGSDRARRYSSEDELPDLRPVVSAQSHHPPSSRPPSSYRGPGPAEAQERPRPTRKSASYVLPTQTTHVSSSKDRVQPLQRSTTVAVTTYEQNEAAAEAYQKERSTLTSEELTAEALKKYNSRHAPSKSETGSSYSRKSHHSASAASSGRERAATNITINGGISVSIPEDYDREAKPVTLDIGDMKITLSSKDKVASRPKDLKRIERAPSVTSQTSRRTSESAVSSSHRERDAYKESSRRPSYVDDGPPAQRLSRTASKRHSRAPSSTRASLEYATRDEPVFFGV